MSNRYGKIRERINALDEKEREVKRTKLREQHACPHNINGDTNECIEIYRNGNGAPTLRCKICGKDDIQMTPPKAVEFREAARTLESGINYIKMMQRESVPQEDELIKRCRDCLDLLTAITKVYDNIENHGGKKKKQDRDARRTAYTMSTRSILD
jgi:hypothetical protein